MEEPAKKPAIVTDTNLNYATHGQRTLAGLGDLFLFSILIIMIPVHLVFIVDFWLNFLLIPPLYIIYETLWLRSRFCATPGKILFKLEVRDEATNRRLSFLQALGRSIIKFFISIFTEIPIIGDVIDVLVSDQGPRKRWLHDWLAHTVVVKKSVISQ